MTQTKSSVLRFADTVRESGASEQQGMMFLCSGALLAVRNPRAHQLLEDHSESAIDMLIFVSFLMKSLDRATRA
jgi:hypothetical protein